mgnify:CR=1 FL=1
MTALLFAIAGALEVLIFWGSMVTLNISPELRRWRDFARFTLVCLIAPITASLAVLIWNTAHGLDPGDGRRDRVRDATDSAADREDREGAEQDRVEVDSHGSSRWAG